MLQPTSLLAIDSTGKTTGKSFCHRVCDQYRWCTPIYMPGAAFEELVDAVTRSPMQHDKLCIVSMGNKVVEMNWDFYMQIRETKVWPAALRLAEHITKNAVKEHLILFGGDVALWEDAKWPTEYPFIQQDILFMLSHLGLNAGTGMESENGDFGRFRGKLHISWHIEGVWREEAEQWLGAVLNATSRNPTSMAVATAPKIDRNYDNDGDGNNVDDGNVNARVR